MQTEALEAIRAKTAAIPTAIRPAINGSVDRIQRVYREITGIGRSRKFFYSEGSGLDEQRTLMQRTALLFFAIAWASEAKANLFIAEVCSWRDLRRQFAEQPLIVTSEDIWHRAEQCSGLLQSVNRAWGSFDIPAAKQALVALISTAETMLRLLNTMPEFNEKQR